jgi:orotate phosphoribosyltransferase
MNFKTLKQNYIQGLLDTKALLVKSINEEPFTMRNGKKSCMYMNHSKLATSPHAYKAFIDAIQFLLKETYREDEFIVCNVDSKISSQMVGSVAYNLKKPQIIYKSSALTAIEKGTHLQMTGDPTWNLPVAILDDVSSGYDATAKGVGDLAKETFKKIPDVQIFVGYIREIKQTTYKMRYLLTREELVTIVWNDLTPGQQAAIEKERKTWE